MAVSMIFTLFLLCLAERSTNADHPLNEICQLPKESGPCLAYFEVWYYDATTDKCTPFVYGGCQGNKNRFKTKGDCEDLCKGSVLTSSSDELPHKSAGHEENTPPCQLEKMSKEKNGPLIGAYIPQCDKDGYYHLKQCWGSTGSCWCVDKFGREIKGKTANAGEELDCEHAPASRKPPCFQALENSLEPDILIHGLPVPLFSKHKPSCDENGYFKPKQCQNMMCWCTDKWGNKIKNSQGQYDEVEC